MKIAIIRLSGNVTDKNKESVGNKELFGIASLIHADVLSCKKCENTILVDENFDINQYDKVLVLNDSVNMFGGCEITTMTTVYKLLHKYEKQIYYILTDLSLPFVDYNKLIKNKPWNNYSEDEFTLKNDIIILSQAYNLDIVKKIHKNINIKDIIYVPFEQWKLYTEPVIKNSRKTVELIYGGSFRTGRREKKFVEYFFNRNIGVEIYGNMKLDQFKNVENLKAPVFTGKINNSEVLKKNSTALSTIIMGDNNYNNNIVTLRFIEALMSDTICFIDNDFDTEHRLMDDYFYVHNGEELETKIEEIKQNEEFYKGLLYLQNNKLLELLNNNLPKQILDILEKGE